MLDEMNRTNVFMTKGGPIGTKKQAFGIFVTLSLFITLAVAFVYGQSANTMVVKIPFKFGVSNATLAFCL